MKITLVNSQVCDVVAAFTSKVLKVVEFDAVILQSDSPSAHGKEDAKLFTKFKKAFDQKFGKAQWSIMVQFDPIKEDRWRVTVTAPVLEAIHQLMHYGNAESPLQMEVQLNCYLMNCFWEPFERTAQIKLNDFKPLRQGEGQVSHGCYETTMEMGTPPRRGYFNPLPIKFGLPLFCLTNIAVGHSWILHLEVGGTNFVSRADLGPTFSNTNRKILTDKDFCDFEIISEDGTVIPCHKIFLCAKSPVFTQMLHEKRFKEARENKMTIDDMSTEGINALLEFLYCDEVHQALANCQVALELLKASDKYDIPTLWKLMVTILVDNSHAWYTVDVALKLFSFSTNCQREESAGLMDKMIQVLSLKSEQLADSAVFQELFPSAVSRTFVKFLSLEAAKTVKVNLDLDN